MSASPQIRGTDGKLTADITKTYSLISASPSIQERRTLWTGGRDAPDSTHVRGMGSVCSTTELGPLVVSVCTQEPIFRTAV